MFFARHSPKDLAGWCSAIKHGHGAGLPLVKVFDTLARSGPRGLRAAATSIRDALKSGDSLDDAVKKFVPNAPPVFRAMTVVADQTGHIPEVFGQLEIYFREQEKLERQFRAQAARPVIQFVLAVFILTAVVFTLAFIGPQAEAVFGGGPKRLVFGMVAVGLLIGAAFVLFRYLKNSAERQAKIGAFLLRLPTVGGCLTALAMGRFCLAMKLTMDSSLPVERAVQLSLEATGIEAFTEQGKHIGKQLERGAELAEAVGENPVFPPEFLAVLAVAEVSGQIPEVMARQAVHYREEATRRFASLTRQMNFALSVVVGLSLIAAIFTLYSSYLNNMTAITE